MCKKCNEEIKAALDRVVVAALKMARLTGAEYSVSSVLGLVFVLTPIFEGAASPGGEVAVIVRPSSSAQELKGQVASYMTRLSARTLDTHARVEIIDKSNEAHEASPDAN